MTIYQQVLDFVMSLLNTGTPAGVPATKKSYLWAHDDPSLPSMCLYIGKIESSPVHNRLTSPITHRQITVKVEIRASGSSVATPDEVADPLVAWAVKALAGQSAKGLIHVIEEAETEYEFDDEHHNYVLVTVSFTVRTQSNSSDLEQFV